MQGRISLGRKASAVTPSHIINRHSEAKRTAQESRPSEGEGRTDTQRRRRGTLCLRPSGGTALQLEGTRRSVNQLKSNQITSTATMENEVQVSHPSLLLCTALHTAGRLLLLLLLVQGNGAASPFRYRQGKSVLSCLSPSCTNRHRLALASPLELLCRPSSPSDFLLVLPLSKVRPPPTNGQHWPRKKIAPITANLPHQPSFGGQFVHPPIPFSPCHTSESQLFCLVRRLHNREASDLTRPNARHPENPLPSPTNSSWSKPTAQ